jgi:hypothetical protein
MKPATRKYKNKNRKTRRGGSNTQVKAPEAIAPKVEATAAPEQKSFWGSIFGSASKPGDKIVKAAEELKTLANPKMGDITNKTLKSIIDEAKALQ